MLSEFTGAADELSDALLVNPHDIDGMKATLVEAAQMPASEQKRRMSELRDTVIEHDVKRWATSFLADLTPALPKRRR